MTSRRWSTNCESVSCVPTSTPSLSHTHHRIPDSISKDIEKRCQSIYPLHDVFIRKVKVLKKPKFDSECQV